MRHTIAAKLGNMRKSVEWTVYPRKEDDRIIIQSNHYIAVFNSQGRGLLSKRQSGGAYLMHLSPACGATPVQVDQAIVKAALDAASVSGEEVGPGVRVL